MSEDVRDLSSGVANCLETLQLGADTALDEARTDRESRIEWQSGIQASIGRQEARRVREERQQLLDWISTINFAARWRDLIGRRHKGTGRWLLETNEFKTWAESDGQGQVLFCPGNPGSGKSILASVVVEELCARFKGDELVGIAYVFCDFRRQDELKPDALLGSILRQLVHDLRVVPGSLLSLFEECRHKLLKPTLDETVQALRETIGLYSRVFVVVDALDESQASGGRRSRFLSELFGLQKRHGANVLVTSSFVPEITSLFKDAPTIEIRARKDDVAAYLEGRMGQLPSFIQRDSQLQEEIRAAVLGAADGLYVVPWSLSSSFGVLTASRFLMAHLSMNALEDTATPKAVRMALGQLKLTQSVSTGAAAISSSPEDKSGVLSQTYAHITDRINSQTLSRKTLAKHALAWITRAKRPLTNHELRHGLGIELGQDNFDDDNLPRIQDVVSACCGLITADGEDGVVRFVHCTAQEFLEQTQHSWFPGNMDTYIATVCVEYLSFEPFADGMCRGDDQFEERLRTYPLYDYAARHWGHHTRDASTDTESDDSTSVLDFLGRFAHLQAASQALFADKEVFPSGYSQQVPQQVTGLHLAAHFGLDRVACALLLSMAPEDNVDQVDSCGRTALSWAAENGHGKVVRLLLETGQAEPDSIASGRYNQGRTPLSFAAGCGHGAAMCLLLDTGRVDVNRRDRKGWSPLCWAAGHGHDHVVELLLCGGGVSVKSRDNDGLTPLHWAARSGHEIVVGSLLYEDPGPEHVNARDNNGRTALSWAVGKGFEGVVADLLEEESVEADLADYSGWTPLSWAAGHGHDRVVEMLLATGRVDVNTTDMAERTPLSWAVGENHERVVTALLSADDIDVNLMDDKGWTPLSWAAGYGYGKLVALLLETGRVDVNLVDEGGRSPLSWAAGAGYEGVVALLLNAEGAEVDVKDNGGWTPLSWAAGHGHASVVAQLLATDRVDTNSKDNGGTTPLQYAVANGQKAVVTLLSAAAGRT